MAETSAEFAPVSGSAGHGVGRWDDSALRCFGVESPLVCVGFAVEHGEHEQDDAADEWDKCDEVPPTAFADVVEAPDGDGEGRDEEYYAIREHDAECDHVRFALIREGYGKQYKKHHDDGVEKLEVPVFFAARATAEVCGSLPGQNEPGHKCLLFGRLNEDT